MTRSRLGISVALTSTMLVGASLLGTPAVASADSLLDDPRATSQNDATVPEGVTFEETPVPATEGETPHHAAGAAPQEAPTPQGSPQSAPGEDEAADAETREMVEPFQMVGVTWESDRSLGEIDVAVQVHTRGQWGEWTVLDGDAESPEGGRAGTDPLWLGEPADGVAVRVTAENGTPADVKVMTIDPAADDAIKPALYRTSQSAAVRSAADVASQPPIITRRQWGAGSGTTCDRTTSPTRGIVLHHTAGNNTYQRGDSAAIVRGIQTMHVKGNGWCDIGYNFLVDKYGQIFEGRAGSIGGQVRGAHAGIWAVNDASIGISMMGNFEQVNVPEATRASVVRLSAWRLSRVGANPYGLYQAGGRSYNVIGAHREVTSTACPGRYGYAWLPNYRDRVASAMTNASPLVKAPGNPAIYLASEGKKYHVPDMAELNVFVAGFGAVREVPKSTIDKLASAGRAIRYVRDPKDGALFLLQNDGERGWFPTLDLVGTYGYKVHDYTPLPASLLSHFRRGADVGPVFASEGSSTLYYIEGSRKRHLTTVEAWREVNHGKTTYSRMSGARAAKIPAGPKLFSSSNTLRAQNAAEVYVPLTDGAVAHTPSFELAREYGANVDRTVEPSTIEPSAVVRDELTPFVTCSSQTFVVAAGALHPIGTKTSTAGWTPTALPSSQCDRLHRAKGTVNDRSVFIKVPGEDPVYLLQNKRVRHVAQWSSVLTLNGGASPKILDWKGATIHSVGWGPTIP